ncbi:MAG: SIMPL domain-containing protein [Gemmatimonadaceae bacterium]
MALAVVIGSIAIAGALKNIRRSDDAVTVTGSARRPIRSDFVVWRATVSTQLPSLSAASQELQRQAVHVHDFLKAQGIADSIIAQKPVEAYPVNETTGDGRDTGRILAYRVSQTFELRSADVDGITRLSQKAGELISQGVPLATQSPEYLFTKLADLRITLLEEATKDAKQRAEAITRSTGGSVGAVRDAKMGVFQITPRYSTEVSDYGVYDVTSIDKDVTAVVRVTFAVR